MKQKDILLWVIFSKLHYRILDFLRDINDNNEEVEEIDSLRNLLETIKSFLVENIESESISDDIFTIVDDEVIDVFFE